MANRGSNSDFLIPYPELFPLQLWSPVSFDHGIIFLGMSIVTLRRTLRIIYV